MKDVKRVYGTESGMSALETAIRNRRSVRTFDGKGLLPADKEKLETFIAGLADPFQKNITYQFLSAKEQGLNSPVLSGEKIYLAGKVKKGKFADVAFGYSFEQIVLFAQQEGIATVWIAGTMNRGAFEQAVELQPDEIMPAVTPLGYEAKMSLKETMMRKGVKADLRHAFSEIFFQEDFQTPLEEDGSAVCKALEMVRLAPSAVNKQPWRAVVSGNTVHFFEHKDKGYDQGEKGDLQKVDVGIGLAHFDLMMKDQGISGTITEKDPGLPLPADTEYIISWVQD